MKATGRGVLIVIGSTNNQWGMKNPDRKFTLLFSLKNSSNLLSKYKLTKNNFMTFEEDTYTIESGQFIVIADISEI